MTELRDHLQLVCRSNEALGDARWEGTEGAASQGIASEAWFQQDLCEYRACSSSFALGFIPIVRNESTQVAMNTGMGKGWRKHMTRSQFKSYLNL